MTKDERIAQLKIQIKELQDDNRNLRKGLNKEGLDYFITKTNSLRHEICEKIREKADKRIAIYDGTKFYAITNELLDQIERGEE